MTTETPPVISVIIPAYNEERYIGRCLDALLPQVRAMADAGGPCEVLVIDNGSTDGTAAECAARGLRVHSAPKQRVGAVRNLGASLARGRLLAFLDADCVPCEDWLRAATASQETGECLTGSTYALPANAHWIEAAWFATEEGGRRPATHINAGNLIVPAATFREVGGFDESLASGEDFELAQRARAKVPVISDDRIRVAHLGNPKTLRHFIQREIWHGLGALASARHDWRDKPLLGTVSFALGCVGILAGLVAALAGHGSGILVLSVILTLSLLLATVEYRTRFRHGLVLRARLFLLYALFYSGRTVALLRLAAGRTQYVRGK